jgi:dolichol-phosphate mannosyltransferase
MKTDLFISVIVPVLASSGEALGEFAQKASRILSEAYTHHEIIFIDSGEFPEATQAITRQLQHIECLRLIRLSRRFSFDVAVIAGLESCIGDYVVIMNPLSDPPELIPEMVGTAGAGAGLVVGVDESPSRKGWSSAGLSSLFHWYVRRYLGADLIPNSTQFRVLSRKAVNAVIGIKGKYRQLRFITSTVGYGTVVKSYTPMYRTRPSFVSLASEAADLLIATSSHPLRAVSLIGLGASVVNLVYLFYVLFIYLWKRDVAPGWTTLSLQTGGMFFLLFLLLALLSEYVGRILAETRSEPLYNVSDELNSSVLLNESALKRNVVSDSR